MIQTASAQVANSIRRYRRAWRRYERNHPEIFNPIEQDRLRTEIARTLDEIASADPSDAPRAFDLGCGSGNLTRHLLELGAAVTAADVSPEFLRLVQTRYGSTGRLRVLEINGEDLSEVADESLDIICAYSVLHHVPDYLAMVDEMCRVARPGGIVYIDHEATDAFYEPDGCFAAMMREVKAAQAESGPSWWDPDRLRWQRYLSPPKYLAKARRMIDPTPPWAVEGDIHIFPEDRIEWDQVEGRLDACGCDVVRTADYLCYSADYPAEIWQRYSETCAGTRLLVARRRA